MKNKVLLHIGAGNDYKEGFINSDKINYFGRRKYKLDLIMDLSKPWPYKDESVDGIVSMHVFPHMTWAELIPALRESYRVLRKGGVMRFGCLTIEMENRSLEYLLNPRWNIVNLFSSDLLKRVLVNRIGYREFREYGFKESSMSELAKVDNRQGKTRYFEVTK